MIIFNYSLETVQFSGGVGASRLRSIKEIRILFTCNYFNLQLHAIAVFLAYRLDCISLAEEYRSVFSGFSSFNTVQSQAFDHVS